jgi:tRNA(fMet)-specific endonuclease VapC
MLRYMLDTDICIHVMKRHPTPLKERFSRLAEQLSISSITLAELHYGAQKSARRSDNLAAIEGFAARLAVLTFTSAAAAHYGDVRAALERIGKTAGSNDMLIAAHARSEGLIVVTNNEREFSRIDGLQVENWL